MNASLTHSFASTVRDGISDNGSSPGHQAENVHCMEVRGDPLARHARPNVTQVASKRVGSISIKTGEMSSGTT